MKTEKKTQKERRKIKKKKKKKSQSQKKKKNDTDKRICIQTLSDSISLLIKAHPDCSKNEPASRQTTSHVIKSLITSTSSLLLFKKQKWLQLQLLNKAEIITCAVKSIVIKIGPKSDDSDADFVSHNRSQRAQRWQKKNGWE